MTTATAALVAALAALTAVAFVTVAVARSRRRSDRLLQDGLRLLGARMDELSVDLSTAVDRLHADAVRARIVESLAQALDLDELLTRGAEAAALLSGATAASATADLDGERHAGCAGIDRYASVAPPPDDGPVRAIAVSYHYAAEWADGRLRSAIAVPLVVGKARAGFLTVFGLGEEPPVTGAEFTTLEEIARQLGEALGRAQGRESFDSPPGAGDPLTELPARRALHETLTVEVARARRHGRRLAVCLVEIADLARITRMSGAAKGDAVVAAVADGLRAVAGPGLQVFRCGVDEFAAVLRDAGRMEADAFAARLQAALQNGRPGAVRVALHHGVSELTPDDDAVSLYERAERSLRRRGSTGTAA